jgi:glutamine amidotransferase
MIIIIDYGLGNLGSIQNMLRRLGYKSQISSDKFEIENASKLILPGVGSFDTGIKNIENLDLWETINYKVQIENVPVLGICLGMQLMCKSSEEGIMSGFGWFDASVLSFNGQFQDGLALPVPNMGWRNVFVEKENVLCNNLPFESRYYFVHSYFIKSHKTEDILMTSHYGFKYTIALNKGNIYGVQFHPEKSHKYGFQLLKNFAELDK